jgi:hypothetical protein
MVSRQFSVSMPHKVEKSPKLPRDRPANTAQSFRRQ